MNCTTKIKVTEHFQQNSLLTREVASQLMQRISQCSCCNKVELDFSNIEFISRSFADQFHKEKVAYFESGEKEIIVLNAVTDVFQMFQAVSKTQKDVNRKHLSFHVVQFENRRSFKHYLTSVL